MTDYIYQGGRLMLKGGTMSLQGKQFKVTWMDQELEEHSKVYDTHEQAHKAYKWLLKNKAINVDLAILR